MTQKDTERRQAHDCEDVVNAYLDCGRFESGFARVRCSGCGAEMRILSVILEHRVITRIPGRLAHKGIAPGRGPPERLRSPLAKTELRE